MNAGVLRLNFREVYHVHYRGRLHHAEHAVGDRHTRSCRSLESCSRQVSGVVQVLGVMQPAALEAFPAEKQPEFGNVFDGHRRERVFGSLAISQVFGTYDEVRGPWLLPYLATRLSCGRTTLSKSMTSGFFVAHSQVSLSCR